MNWEVGNRGTNTIGGVNALPGLNSAGAKRGISWSNSSFIR